MILKCTTPNCKCKNKYSMPSWDDVKNKSPFINAVGGNSGDNPSQVSYYDIHHISKLLAPKFNYKHDDILALIHPDLYDDVVDLPNMTKRNNYIINKPVAMTELGYIDNVRLTIFPGFVDTEFHYPQASNLGHVIYPIVFLIRNEKVFETNDITVLRCTKG